MLRSLFVLLFLSSPALAQDWNLRPGDRVLEGEELDLRVSTGDLVFFDDGTSRFSAGGAYSYTYSELNGGSSHFGTWDVVGPGEICILFRNGAARCDLYVEAQGRLVVLTEDGGRYPVRP